jgi:hypothetical protein
MVRGSEDTPKYSAVEQVVLAKTPTLKSVIDLRVKSIRVRLS